MFVTSFERYENSPFEDKDKLNNKNMIEIGRSVLEWS